MNLLSAKYYADHALQQEVAIVENIRIARDTFRVRFRAPEIARQIMPGQFVMLRLAGWNDPLIGRPLAMYDVGDDWVDVVYLVKGKFTRALAELRSGALLSVWGPLGNGFSAMPVEHLVMVAGGIGQTPFLALGKQFLGGQSYGAIRREQAPAAKRVTLLYGARSADYLAGLAEFAAAGIDVHVATDDGTAGRKGLVTDLLRTLLDQTTSGIRIACCGPEPMMEAVAHLAAERGVPCEVSLETPMACGIGICFTCVAKVRDASGEWDYKRTCVEGPVFEASSIVW